MKPHEADQVLAEPWRERLEALIAERMARPFEWGVHDCCLWAADCVLAQTEHDPAQTFRGTYHSASEAARLVEQLGGMESIGAMGGTPCLPLAASVGDIGLVTYGGRESLAVCIGEGWLAPAAEGLAVLPFDAARSAWRVSRG